MFLLFFRYYVYIPAFTLFLLSSTCAIHSMGYSQWYGLLATYFIYALIEGYLSCLLFSTQ